MQQLKIKDRDFSSLKEGDEVTIIYTINANGRANDAISGTRTFDTHTFNRYPSAFVSKRAPREPKVGDKFVWKNGDPTAPRTILFIDDADIFYEYGTTGPSGMSRTHMPRAQFNRSGVLL